MNMTLTINMPPWYTILMPNKLNANYLRTFFNIQIVLLIIIIVLTTSSSFCLASPCDSNNWWNSIKDRCIPCTKCNKEENLLVLRPCQLHQDTICGRINDIEIDWFLLTRTEPNWKDRRKEEIHLISESLRSSQDNDINDSGRSDRSTRNENELVWDNQLVTFILAIVACLAFFLAIGYIFIEHMRQWRRMERRLDRDVEELSAKLMAKLAEVQNVESGSFIIENPVKNARPVEVHCVRMEKSKDKKSPILSSLSRQNHDQSRWKGNLYIEENNTNLKH